MKYSCGIDPGLTGAIAILGEDGHIAEVIDMPIIDKELDGPGFWYLFNDWDIAHAYIERSQPMPKQGVVSTFHYGALFGDLRTAIKAKGIPQTRVTPQAWKKTQLAGMPKEKIQSVLRVNQLYPELGLRKTQHGRADAILICRHGMGL